MGLFRPNVLNWRDKHDSYRGFGGRSGAVAEEPDGGAQPRAERVGAGVGAGAGFVLGRTGMLFADGVSIFFALADACFEDELIAGIPPFPVSFFEIAGALF